MLGIQGTAQYCWFLLKVDSTFAQLKKTAIKEEVKIVENGMQKVSGMAVEDF